MTIDLVRTPEFEREMIAAQRALASRDLETITDLIIRRAAREAAERIRSLRKDYNSSFVEEVQE